MKHGARSAQPRKGISLAELIAAMVIMVVLASFALYQVDEPAKAASTASAAYNLTQIHAGLAQAHALGLSMDSLDLLIAPPSARLVDPVAVIPGPSGSDTVDLFDNTQLSAKHVAALNESGLYVAMDHEYNPVNATFGCYTLDRTATVFAPATTVVYVLPEGVRALGLPPAGHYVVFGLGAACELHGPVFPEIPFHQLLGDPANEYSRYLIVFDLSSGEAVPVKVLAESAENGPDAPGLVLCLSQEVCATMWRREILRP